MGKQRHKEVKGLGQDNAQTLGQNQDAQGFGQNFTMLGLQRHNVANLANFPIVLIIMLESAYNGCLCTPAL